MGRTIITTCGTSLLSSGCWTLPGIGSLVGLNDDDRTVQEGINKGVIKNHMNDDSDGQTLARAFDREAWVNLGRLLDLPAELASLRVYQEALARQRPSVTLGGEDKIFLLHSDNPEGEYCAKVLKIVLRGLFTGVEISCDPIRNLDPVDFVFFGEALSKIWRKYCETVNRENNNRNTLIFNLTGGYKAVGMVLTALCVANPAIPVTIIYLHETAPPESLFVMNFQGSTISDRLLTGYCNEQCRSGPAMASI